MNDNRQSDNKISNLRLAILKVDDGVWRILEISKVIIAAIESTMGGNLVNERLIDCSTMGDCLDDRSEEMSQLLLSKIDG